MDKYVLIIAYWQNPTSKHSSQIIAKRTESRFTLTPTHQPTDLTSHQSRSDPFDISPNHLRTVQPIRFGVMSPSDMFVSGREEKYFSRAPSRFFATICDDEREREERVCCFCLLNVVVFLFLRSMFTHKLGVVVENTSPGFGLTWQTRLSLSLDLFSSRQ